MTVAAVGVTTGLERLTGGSGRAIGGLKGRVGLVSNPASVNGSLRHAADCLDAAKSSGVTLAALFGPQHGFRSDLQDNMIETPHADHAARRIPIYSLYSETREPTAEMLRGLDVLVIDLQDVGTRIYTFVYTMANCLRACARHGVKAVVCDRPNPIGGAEVEGPVLDPKWTSFVGQFPIPMRHGMTIGELAGLFNEHFGIGARSRGRGHGRLASLDVLRSDAPVVGHAVAEHPDTGHGDRVSGCGAVRGNEYLRGPWDDPAVRAPGRTVD